MGAGKTTIGRRLAKTLGREFIDSDKTIEQRTGVTIPVIWEMEGEAGFRLREKNIIAELCQQSDIVLATGGGVVLDVDNRRCLTASGFVVYLYTEPEEQLRRIRNDANRPLLQTDDPLKRLRELLRLRDPLYRAAASYVIHTKSSQFKKIVSTISKQFTSWQASVN